MRFNWLSSLGAMCALALVASCALEPDLVEDEVSSEVTAANGKSLNGVSLNGVSLNGKSLNGKSLNGVSLSGISLGGVSLTGASVSNTVLQAVRSGATVRGAALNGATLQGQLSTGDAFTLRINNMYALAAPNADVSVYVMDYQTTTGWIPLCPGANEAILFPGTWNMVTIRHQWDANMFMLSCRTATFAKCEELGYKGDAKIDTYHQACIRALRADYCGQGASYTTDGTLINLYDAQGTQTDTATWSVEANWTPDGATCLNKARVISGSLTVPNVPECIAVRAATPCTTSTWGSTLIRTEVNK